MKVTKVKKITAVLCALLCAIGSTFICSAASQRYTINEIDDMVIYLPDDMTAITRSSQNTDNLVIDVSAECGRHSLHCRIYAGQG